MRVVAYLDEWQVVPGVLGVIKRSVDVDPRPGRFLVTGSVQSSTDAGVVLHTEPLLTGQ